MNRKQLNDQMDIAFARVTRNTEWVHLDGSGCSLVELLIECGNAKIAESKITKQIEFDEMIEAVQETLQLSLLRAGELIGVCAKIEASVTQIQIFIRGFLLEHMPLSCE